MGRLTRAALVAGAVVATGLGVGVPSAEASAYGCSYWGAGSYGGYPYAAGQYCVSIDGSGTWVNSVGGGFSSAGNVCNWNITAEFFDSAGRWYQTITGPMHYSCSHNAQDAMWIGSSKRVGRMCSTLKTNGSRITSVCHNITY